MEQMFLGGAMIVKPFLMNSKNQIKKAGVELSNFGLQFRRTAEKCVKKNWLLNIQKQNKFSSPVSEIKLKTHSR